MTTKAKISQIQLGKNGITDNFMATLKSHFERHTSVRISVLKGAGRDKKKVKGYADEILNNLGNHYRARVIGFVIAFKKYRKPVR